MRRIKLFSAFVLLTLLLSIVTMGAIPGGEAQATSDTNKIHWLTYTDPRYGLSIDYPADWYVIPRDDSLGVGATLTFSDVDSRSTTKESLTSEQSSPIKVEIGMYLVEWSTGESLDHWTVKYDRLGSAFEASEEQVKQSRRVHIDGLDALRREGVSPLAEFSYVNIPRRKIVWFIWTNSGEAQIPVYNHMVASFKFGDNTPRTLQEVYGAEFKPLPLDQTPIERTHISRRPPGLARRVIAPLAIGYWWRVPVNGSHNVRCDSSFHTGGAAFAIDIPLVKGTPVYAAQTGDVVFAG